MPPHTGAHAGLYLHFLHGFLGQPSDWQRVATLLRPAVCFFYSLEQFLALPKADDGLFPFAGFVTQFHKNVFFHPSGRDTKHILIGYSLGGRLALHCLLQKPSRWDGAILISTHPGLSSEEEKQQRLEHDGVWARRFHAEPWQNLMTAWQAQPVFQGFSRGDELDRHDTPELRRQLIALLTTFSLGRQNDLRPLLGGLSLPVLWITGEKDIKFCNLAKEVQLLSAAIQTWTCPNAAHRVPWENATCFASRCNLFLNQWD